MSEFIAVDTNFILSVLIKRNNTEKALKILSNAIENYEKSFVPNHVIVETIYVLEGLHKYESKNINFGDALIAIIVLNKGINKIISFDSHFLKIKEFEVINSI
jgi:predicted nucleic acid-binding protein